MNLNYSFPATILKSGEENNNRIPITIIPNAPTVDRVSEKILLKAYDKECIEGFLFDGIIDYDHQSILGASPLEKAQAIIGEPENFYVDKIKKLPVIEGYLFKGNPYVDSSIYPALKAGSKKVAASLGGKILRKSDDIDASTNKKIKAISKISLKHVALTPLQKAVHQSSSVMLRKSQNGEGEEIYECQFDSFDTFMKSFTDAEDLQKALIAGSATDISNLSGGQALQKQSLEGSRVNRNKIKYTLPFILENVLSKSNSLYTTNDYIDYLIKKGFNEYEAIETIQLLARNGAKIVELFI